VQPDGRRRRPVERSRQAILLRLHPFDPLQQPLGAQALGDRVVQPLQPGLDPLVLTLQAGALDLAVAVRAVDLGVQLGGEGAHRLRLHEPVLQGIEDQLLQVGPADRLAVIAGPELAGGRAGQVVPPHRRVAAAADATVDKPGQEVRRPSL
jgi:hypothetical protein